MFLIEKVFKKHGQLFLIIRTLCTRDFCTDKVQYCTDRLLSCFFIISARVPLR